MAPARHDRARRDRRQGLDWRNRECAFSAASQAQGCSGGGDGARRRTEFEGTQNVRCEEAVMTQAQSAPSTAMAIANWFLKRSWDDPGYPACNQLKLYKLVYLAHAWHLGNGRGPLFPEDVEAWPHGPVVRDLYIEFKDAGRKPIGKLGTRLMPRDDRTFAVETPEPDSSLDGFLTAVWDTYRKRPESVLERSYLMRHMLLVSHGVLWLITTILMTNQLFRMS